MNQKQIACDPRRISLFFRQQLTENEQSLFERHLEGCQKCRDDLEFEAAHAEDWSLARDSLSSETIEPVEFQSPSRVPLSGWYPADRTDGALSFLSPTDDPRMIGRLGAYEIVGIIGQGGMGIVLKGLDPALNRYVAIKVLAPHLAASGSARLRFAREAKAAAAVTHENVVAIHGVSEWNGLPYLVMPYVRGESLQKRLDQCGMCELSEILRVGRQVAAGLTAAHVQGLVHRDIKPANILLEDGVERLKITDFGLARAVDDASLTRTGVIAGTPQFMSPEQARGEAIDARSDLFSLGSVLYAMSTGRPPFRAETSYGILRRITDTEPRPIQEVNPSIPEWLVVIIGRLHAKNVALRFETAHEVAEVFEQCLAHIQHPTVVPLPAICQKRAARSSTQQVLKVTGAIIAILLISTLIWQFWPGPDHLAGNTAADLPSEKTSGSADLKVGIVELPTSPNSDISKHEPVVSNPPLDWDTTAQEIQQLQQENSEFNQRVNRIWDD